MYSPDAIARVCHEALRALATERQPSWELALPWVRESCVEGVNYALTNPRATPEDMHGRWVHLKSEEGWVLGVLDPQQKSHPLLLAWDELPLAERLKQRLFLAIVRALEPEDSGGGPDE